MTYYQLREKAEAFYPAVLLDKKVPFKRRKLIRGIAMFLIITSLAALSSIVLPLDLNIDKEIFAGIFFMSFSFWVAMHLLEAMYYSYYFHDQEMYFEVAKVILSDSTDLTKAFLSMPIGKYVMWRCGISNANIKAFLKNRNKTLPPIGFTLVDGTPRDRITLADFGYALLKYDRDLAYFLFERGVGEQVFRGAAEWVSYNAYLVRNKERWWSRTQLSKVPSIGKNWSYGQVPMLERYARLVDTHTTPLSAQKIDKIFTQDVENLELVLRKNRQANAIVVSDDGVGGVDIIRTMASQIARGVSHPYFEDKRIFIMHGVTFLEATGDRFQEECLMLLNEAHNAGNVILVIEQMAAFVERGHAKGIDVIAIMEPYLNSNVSIVGLTDSRGYHRTLEAEPAILAYFEKIIAYQLDADMTLTLLQNEVYALEAKYKVLFTYPSLIAIVQSAERYFAESVLADKALDLIHEVVPEVVAQKKKMIFKEDVLNVVETRTNIPQGINSKDQKENLLNLEQKLHERISGQQSAITAISKTLRRVNAGVSRTKRPLGTFLFAGPTGVGKTETAKALAEIFFGGPDMLIRFDMTEFAGADGLAKLIGHPGTPGGQLSMALREKPYGVLLLDEFEKSHPDVHNLFLQILDEGMFTDSRGESISARNTVIIATSNVGSEIWSGGYSGNSEDQRAELVDYIINNRIFRPELLNRFDGIVVYEHLSEDDLRGIARIQVYALRDRLLQQSIDLNINPFLLSYVVSKGTSSQFGAREMQRAIADNIESVIAEKIISGDIGAGDVITFDSPKGEGEFTMSVSRVRN